MQQKKIIFFGCPLDCDEKYDAIQEKRLYPLREGVETDPLTSVLASLESRNGMPAAWDRFASVPVADWLKPMVPADLLHRIRTENFVRFIDENGCRQISDQIDRFVSSSILPNIPCMVAVDHSLTGGVYHALSKHFGAGEISLIVLDSHTDALPMSVLEAAIRYDIDTNPNTVYDLNDPFIHQRSESYNASSFLHHMIEEGTLDPRDLYLFGVGDYPDKRMFKNKDERIRSYTRAFSGLKRSGATVISKKECQLQPAKLRAAMGRIRTPFVYVSVDMDIGSGAALEGVRFRDRTGLKERQIYQIVAAIRAFLTKEKVSLVGMDLVEFNVRLAGGATANGKDRTYEIAAEIIKQITEPENKTAT